MKNVEEVLKKPPAQKLKPEDLIPNVISRTPLAPLDVNSRQVTQQDLTEDGHHGYTVQDVVYSNSKCYDLFKDLVKGYGRAKSKGEREAKLNKYMRKVKASSLKDLFSNCEDSGKLEELIRKGVTKIADKIISKEVEMYSEAVFLNSFDIIVKTSINILNVEKGQKPGNDSQSFKVDNEVSFKFPEVSDDNEKQVIENFIAKNKGVSNSQKAASASQTASTTLVPSEAPTTREMLEEYILKLKVEKTITSTAKEVLKQNVVESVCKRIVCEAADNAVFSSYAQSLVASQFQPRQTQDGASAEVKFFKLDDHDNEDTENENEQEVVIFVSPNGGTKVIKLDSTSLTKSKMNDNSDSEADKS